MLTVQRRPCPAIRDIASICAQTVVLVDGMPKYDIFWGSAYRDALWIEEVEGLSASCDRMRELAAECPGPYFVFCTPRGVVVANVDSSKLLERAKGQAAS
jgi:hypothetical protein